MSSKNVFKRIPKPVVTLALISLIAGLALSSVFTLTESTIAYNKELAAQEAFRAVLPEAETFEKIPLPVDIEGQVYGDSFGRSFINEAVAGKDAAGSVVGYAVSATCAEGYSGNVTLTVGVKPDGALTSVSFTELKETPGKGMLCDEPAFKDRFAGRNVPAFKLLKDGGASAPDEIDGVSGATISSKAVVNAVNAALDFCATQIGR